MATAVKNYGSVSLSSSYTAYCLNQAGNHVHTTGDASTSDSSTYAADFATLGIPTGSTINSAVLTYTVTTWPAHGAAIWQVRSEGNVVDSWLASGDSFTLSAITTFSIRFRSGKDSTNYPAMSPTPYVQTSLTNTSSYKLSNLTLTVDYTLPYATKVWVGTEWQDRVPVVYRADLEMWYPCYAYVWDGTAWKPGLK